MSEPAFTYDTFVSFGDCDPAGIVFYPNFFRLFDRCFHLWLMAHGGHLAICEEIGARGIGLIDLHAQFRAPLRAGQEISVELRPERWGSRAFTLGYRVLCEDRLHVAGTETRSVFVDGPRGMMAGETRRLRELVAARNR